MTTFTTSVQSQQTGQALIASQFARTLRVVSSLTGLEKTNQIPLEFSNTVKRLKISFRKLNFEIADLERQYNLESPSSEALSDDAKEIIEKLRDRFASVLENPVSQLERICIYLSESARQECFEYFRAELGHFLYQCPFSKRSMDKPLGYAGDYEMMNMLYQNSTLGETLFAKSLHRYVVNMAGGVAVRNRAHYLKKKIEEFVSNNEGQIRILSVASGPAFELRLLLKELPQETLSRIEFNLLDQDQQSLDFAKSAIRDIEFSQGILVDVKFLKIDMRRVIGKGLDEKYDLIYSAGLYDYFTEKVARRVTERLLDSVTQNGQLIVGNFGIANSSRFFMEMAWDWPLYHRTVPEMESLFSFSGRRTEIESEPSGVNLFAIVS